MLQTISTPMPPQHHLNPEPVGSLTIPTDPSEARRFQDKIEQALKQTDCPPHDLFSIKLALEEALVNAIKHGNQFDRTKNVQIEYRILADRFECRITDEGTGFDPNDLPDPTSIENLERPCGRGVMLMRYYMTEVVYSPKGNSVAMFKIFQNGKG